MNAHRRDQQQQHRMPNQSKPKQMRAKNSTKHNLPAKKLEMRVRERERE